MIIRYEDRYRRVQYKNLTSKPDEVIVDMIDNWYEHFDNWIELECFIKNNLEVVSESEDYDEVWRSV